MSVFSFPRLNIKGLIRVDVGTANNDDYSNTALPDRKHPDGSPVLLRLADSKNVQAVTFGMSDPDWIAWVQTAHVFDVVPPPPSAAAAPAPVNKAEGGPTPAAQKTTTQIPAEWNYYGSMAFDLGFVNGGRPYDAKVIGVQYADRTATDDPLVGSVLSFRNRADPQTGRSTGMLIDVNPESVPCSQVFADSLLLQQGARALMLGKPSKAATRWVNFQRNTNLPGPNGAGCAMQCVVPVEELKGQPILDFFAQGKPLPANFKGVVFRYYVSRSLQEINTMRYSPADWLAKIEALYAKQGKNPTYLEVVGTVAPWYDGEMQSLPAGRLLVPTSNTIPIPPGSRGNSPPFQLAPATFQVNGDLGLVSVDFSGTFPDQYQGTTFDPFETGNNPKFDFGEVRLIVRNGTQTLDLGPIPYRDTDAGDRKGWVFDFSTAALSKDQLKLITDGDFFVSSVKYHDLLAEQRYLIASDQSCVFGEQNLSPNATTDQFMNEGPNEVPATIRIYDKGQELSTAAAPKIAVWEYDTTPNQDNKNGKQLPGALAPGQPLVVPCTGTGNRLYTFILPGQTAPPTTNNVNLATAPMINLRLLPNDKNYDEYYVDPTVSQPVGNAKLTFDVIFREVLHNYYLLYPAMSQVVPLNDPQQWSDPEMAGRLMQRTQKEWFDRSEYMPRTRDLSDSRRKLLHAWCLKYLTGKA